MKKHRQALIRGKHHSKYLQRVFNKHGESSLNVEVVLVCEENNLKMYEQLLIDGLSPEFNGAKSANSPVHRGQRLPLVWKEKVAETVRTRYAEGFKIYHPPRSQEYRDRVSIQSKKSWENLELRKKMQDGIKNAMTQDERQKRSERAKKLWADPEYRQRVVDSRKGKASNTGYKCTPEQILNRKKAARISHVKRKHGELWQEAYVACYPEFKGDINA